MGLYVGTSGWAYKEWKPDFYPQDLPQAKFLEFYGKSLQACEINATFYRIQSKATFDRWAAFTPESFRFTTKAHRALTHSKSMVPEGDKRNLLDDFVRSVSTLGLRLGVILLQYPPHRKRDDDSLKKLLAILPPGPRYAIEFRHESWTHPEVLDTIAASGGTVCISNTDGTVPPALPPGPLAYVRMRTERYTEEQREGWRELLAAEGRERDVFAFTKHEGIPAADPYGGIGLAKWLADR